MTSLRRSSTHSELFEVPPKQFIARRNQLAKELKASGDAKAAAEIQKLRKPSSSVWAVIALSREANDAIDRVLEAGAQVRTAQRRALSGAGGAQMRDATRALHDAIRDATARATGLLKNARETASAAVLDRIRDTLMAAAEGDEDLRSALREGRIEEDLSPAGFGMVTPLKVVPGTAVPKRQRERDRRPDRDREALKHHRALMRQEAARAEKAVHVAEHEHTRLDKLAGEAEARAEELRAKAKASALGLEKARRTFAEAQKRLNEAEAELSRR